MTGTKALCNARDMQRIIQQLLNDVVVKAIADNPIVQRVAYNSVEGLKNIGKKAGEAAISKTGVAPKAAQSSTSSRSASTMA